MFLFVFFGVVFSVLACFVSFCVLDDRDSIQDYVSVLHQFTFAATLQERPTHDRRPDGSVGRALVLPALTDCRWWFESLLVHSGVSSATRRKATGADHKKGTAYA